MKIPENYFEEFPTRLEAMIAQEERNMVTKKRKVTLKRYIWASASAAVVAGFIFTGVSLYKIDRNFDRDIAETAVSDYEDILLEDLSIYDLEDILADIE